MSSGMEFPDEIESGGVVYHRLTLTDVLRLPAEEAFAGWRAGPYFYGIRDSVLPGNPLGVDKSQGVKPAGIKRGKGKGKQKADAPAPPSATHAPPVPPGGYGEGPSTTQSVPEENSTGLVGPPVPYDPGFAATQTAGSQKSEPRKEDPLNGTNPARVKGEPRVRALTEEQKLSLRRFFKVVDVPVEPAAWAAMSPKEKTLARAARSIPKWAVAAVARNSRNLEEIIRGRLTKDNFSTRREKTPGSPTQKEQAAATAAWLSVKGRFKGIPLYSNPSRPKEKALWEAYRSLKDRYGDLPCFPKPRKRQSGKKDGKSGGVTTSSGALSGLGEIVAMAKAFGEIAKALRGG